jgi:hypothetical protein
MVRIVGKEGVEDEKERRQAAKEPGYGRVHAKNSQGTAYAWLIYNFNVGDHQLKSNGHPKYLSQILNDIIQYGKLWGLQKTIVISGHASPSGGYAVNEPLARKRAHSVRTFLLRNNCENDWFYVTNDHTDAHIDKVIKAVPTLPWQRAWSRGVLIVLRHMIVGDKVVFPEDLRKAVRAAIINRRDLQLKEDLFYYWVIDNWKYLMNPANFYCRDNARRQQDGLFFVPRLVRFHRGGDIWQYLRMLWFKASAAALRLRKDYTGTNSASMIRAGGNPVLTYQQLARWLCLARYARTSGRSVNYTVAQWLPGVKLQEQQLHTSLRQLIEWINRGEFETDSEGKEIKKEEWYQRIRKEIAKQKIPMKVVTE